MIRKLWNNPYIYVIKIFTVINIILIIVNIGLYVRAAQEGLLESSDFANIYYKFNTYRAEGAEKLFDRDFESIITHGILSGYGLESDVYPLDYPPIISLVFSPLSLLPFNIAYLTWMLIEIGLLIWLIYLLNHLFSDWNKQERISLNLIVLAFWPIAHTFLLGQFSLYLLICLVQMYIAIKNYKHFNAGFWLALMIVKPQTVLVPAMITLNKQYWRVAVSAAITGITLVLISGLLFGFNAWTQFANLLPTISSSLEKYGFYPEIEYTLRGLLTRLLGVSHSSITTSISYIVLLIGMTISLLLFVRGVPSGIPRFNLRFAFVITLSVFLSLHLYDHDNLLLVLPAAIFYNYLRQMGFPTKGFAILLLCSPLTYFIGMFTSFNLFGFIRPPLAITMIMLAWMIKYLVLDFRAGRPKTQTNITYSYPA